MLICNSGSFFVCFVTRWEAPGGWPTILLQYSDAVGWVLGL